MKPTKEIIRLAKKLKDFGYKQEIKEDGWFISQGVFYSVSTIYYNDRGEPVRVGVWDGDHKMLWFGINGIIPIPSLEDGTLWLTKQTEDTVVVSFNKYGSSLIFGLLLSQAETPHEAVLKAMVRVMEEGQC